jgi:hypothetical protein
MGAEGVKELGGTCPIDDWIGRWGRDRGTSITTYMSTLGIKWNRRLALAGL